jgi:sec-independent protein translocase protein TatC
MSSTDMTFWDHLEALRRTLFRMLAVIGVLGIGLFILMPSIYDPIILGPCFGTFPPYRWFCALGQLINLPSTFCDPTFVLPIINIELTAQFLIQFELAFTLAFLVAIPYVLFELWHFISPALYQKEKKGLQFTFTLGGLLFYIGMLLCYLFIFPITLRFLASYKVSEHVVNQLSLASYMSTFTTMNLLFGLVFELPIVALVLSKLGLINRSFFKKWRRHALVILVIIAAVITPTGDPFTLTLVSLPLYLLYELSALLVKPAKEKYPVEEN